MMTTATQKKRKKKRRKYAHLTIKTKKRVCTLCSSVFHFPAFLSRSRPPHKEKRFALRLWDHEKTHDKYSNPDK